jgi:hypothetical protein
MSSPSDEEYETAQRVWNASIDKGPALIARCSRQSYGALHQMLSGLDAAEQEAAWAEIAEELRAYEGLDGFAGACEWSSVRARRRQAAARAIPDTRCNDLLTHARP